MADVVVFLASDFASFVSGQTVVVDGGLLCTTLPRAARAGAISVTVDELAPNPPPSSDEGWFDADAHVIEPPWIWTDYTERSLHERVPRLERRGDAEWLVCDGEDLFAIGRLGGLARGERALRVTDASLDGSWDASIVPGAYLAPERLDAMAIDGVAQALLYPTVAMTLMGIADVDLRRALLVAYNRWIADLCAEQPDRLFVRASSIPTTGDRNGTDHRGAHARTRCGARSALGRR